MNELPAACDFRQLKLVTRPAGVAGIAELSRYVRGQLGSSEKNRPARVALSPGLLAIDADWDPLRSDARLQISVHMTSDSSERRAVNVNLPDSRCREGRGSSNSLNFQPARP